MFVILHLNFTAYKKLFLKYSMNFNFSGKGKTAKRRFPGIKRVLFKAGFISINGLPFFNNILVSSEAFSIHVLILLSLPSMKDKR